MTYTVQPNPGSQAITPLTGAELVTIEGLEWGHCSVAQIAALASTESSPIVNTAITTVGAGVLTAAGLVGGLIVRTGPVAAYTDTTDTAANIIAALPAYVLGETFLIRIKNATNFIQTIAAGTGVTLPSTTTLGPYMTGNYFATATSASTVTITHLNTTAIGSSISVVTPLATSIATVGAGTLTAAALVGGFVLRTGSTSAFTDTTDTAANIIAAQPSTQGRIGESFVVTYTNNTVAVATLAGGTGVTVSGITAVPANSWAKYVLTYTAAATMTMVGVEQGFIPHSGTFANNGTSTVTTADANVTVGSNIVITLKTVGGTVGAIPHLLTVTPGTGFATVGTASDTSTYNYTILG